MKRLVVTGLEVHIVANNFPTLLCAVFTNGDQLVPAVLATIFCADTNVGRLSRYLHPCQKSSPVFSVQITI